MFSFYFSQIIVRLQCIVKGGLYPYIYPLYKYVRMQNLYF